MTFELPQALQILERTPSVLRSMLTGLDEAWIRADEGPDSWSPFDIIGHLVDGEETDWLVRAKIILEHGDSVPFHPFDRFRHLRENGDKTLDQLLDRFANLRAENLQELKALNLTSEQMALPGTHPALGPVRLEQLLSTWVVHDLGHIAQVARVMAKRLTHDVGPWAEYLSVLHR